MTLPDLGQRLWRMRRRRDHIDATLMAVDATWELTFWRNRQSMLVWRYAAETEARREADTRRLDLERAGWVSHW